MMPCILYHSAYYKYKYYNNLQQQLITTAARGGWMGARKTCGDIQSATSSGQLTSRVCNFAVATKLVLYPESYYGINILISYN
jgi:hypothetical protein